LPAVERICLKAGPSTENACQILCTGFDAEGEERLTVLRERDRQGVGT
jgi:hypothetical protein